nr:hypothetical protein [Tanacetum cinerariifolium]
MFDVSLNTIQELDGFVMKFQSNGLGSVISKECADAIIKIVCEHNTTLKNVAKVKKSVGAMLDTSHVTNRQPNMVTPNFSSETHDKQGEFVSVTSLLVSKLIDDVLTSSQIDEEEVAWSKPIDKDNTFATHTLFGSTYVNTSSNCVKIDTPIVQSVDVGGQDNTYARAAGASKKTKPNERVEFCHRVSENIFDGVNILIPRLYSISVRFSALM